jgi:hypothetical protein
MVIVLGSEGASRPEMWHPVVRGVYEYWLSILPAVGLPGRQHVEPCAIPRLLPYVFLIDVERSPLRFRYRLVGTAYFQLMGRELTGCYLDEVHPTFGGEVQQHYTALVEQRQPVYRKGQVMFAVETKRFLGMERIIVPLARNGCDVDMVLGGIVYIPAAPNTTWLSAIPRT